jgi:hypothetical protein
MTPETTVRETWGHDDGTDREWLAEMLPDVISKTCEVINRIYARADIDARGVGQRQL